VTGRRLVLAAGLLLVLVGCQASAGDDAGGAEPPDRSTAAASQADGNGIPLVDAIRRIPRAVEHRAGYERDKFRHWVDADHDGCDTRAEILLAQAVQPPKQGPSCKLSGGSWVSYYDGATVADAGELDIDHVVALAEAWDSGASGWSAERREAYANDIAVPRSLLAVTAKSNRSKSDQDPSEWIPPVAAVACQYAADWMAVKFRWSLTADLREQAALEKIAKGCPKTTVSYTLAS